MRGFFKCCKDCEKRFPGCSTSCESYAAARAKHDAAEKARKADNAAERALLDVRVGKTKSGGR